MYLEADRVLQYSALVKYLLKLDGKVSKKCDTFLTHHCVLKVLCFIEERWQHWTAHAITELFEQISALLMSPSSLTVTLYFLSYSLLYPMKLFPLVLSLLFVILSFLYSFFFYHVFLYFRTCYPVIVKRTTRTLKTSQGAMPPYNRQGSQKMAKQQGFSRGWLWGLDQVHGK